MDKLQELSRQVGKGKPEIALAIMQKLAGQDVSKPQKKAKVVKKTRRRA